MFCKIFGIKMVFFFSNEDLNMNDLFFCILVRFEWDVCI